MAATRPSSTRPPYCCTSTDPTISKSVGLTPLARQEIVHMCCHRVPQRPRPLHQHRAAWPGNTKAPLSPAGLPPIITTSKSWFAMFTNISMRPDMTNRK